MFILTDLGVGLTMLIMPVVLAIIVGIALSTWCVCKQFVKTEKKATIVSTLVVVWFMVAYGLAFWGI